MILQQIQHYLRTHTQVSLEELSRHFQSDANVMRGMLEQLIRKGRVRKSGGKKCGGCQNCAPESLEMYDWINSKS